MESERALIRRCANEVQTGGGISEHDAEKLIHVSDASLDLLSSTADLLTRRINGDSVDVEQLSNVKKNACSEDCSFCSQSAFYNTGIETYELAPPEEIIAQARRAKDEGAGSYCMVAAWREPSRENFEKVCGIIQMINESVGINIECSFGFLTEQQARRLRELGVVRYNHNLETARSKFPEICTTHTYDDRLKTLKAARDAGLELCTGGIIGMGETREQRLELALELASIAPEEVTINILVPVKGTPLELQPPLGSGEIARIFALLRFLLPRSLIKISGGRETALDDDGRSLLRGGANGIITSGYLTMGGNNSDKDAAMIQEIGLA